MATDGPQLGKGRWPLTYQAHHRTLTEKQPYHVRMKDEGPFAFAGLWERWQEPGGEPIESCTILTTEANELMRPLHDRMPSSSLRGTTTDGSIPSPARSVSFSRCWCPAQTSG